MGIGARTVSSGAEDPERFDEGTHWISTALERGLPLGIENRLVTGVVKFNLVPNALAGVYVFTQYSETTASFLVAGALFLAWANFAPYLVWYYDEHVLPQFFTRVSEIVVDVDRLEALAAEYNEYHARFNPLFAVLWGGGFLVAGLFGTGVFEAQGMVGDGRLFLWTTLGYGVYVGGVLGEAGFSGTVTTLLLVREVARLDFEIQPLHPDRLGGLSTVGYFAIRTTVLWSTASLLMPLAFQLVSTGSSFNAAMGVVTLGYIATIVATFLYPTVKINRRSEQLREQRLDELRGAYLKMQDRIEASDDDGLSDINDRLEMRRLRNTYDDYATVRLYPMQVQILLRLAGSVLLPLFFLLLEYYLPSVS